MVGSEDVFVFIEYANLCVKIVKYFAYVLGAYAREQIVFSENTNIPVHNCVNNP